MKVQSILTLATCAALLVTIAGCASRKAATLPMTVTEQTTFEQLRDNIIYNFKGTVPLATKDNWISVAAKAPVAGDPRAAAIADIARWCQYRGGRMFRSGDQDKPDSVKQAERISYMLEKLTGIEADSGFTRSCDVRGATYIFESEFIRWMGSVKLAWLSPQELQTKSVAATAIIDQMRANEAATAEKKRELQIQAENELYRQSEARKNAYLQKADRGTQVVCTGRQGRGMSIADIWYRCRGEAFSNVTTFAEFGKAGWRVGSQTLVPVLMTSGNVEQDVTVIFEKAR